MAQYKDFIPQNVAPLGVRRVGVYNSKGNRVGYIPLGNLVMAQTGNKLYSFGALSDVHVQYDTAHEDFQRALEYLNDTEDVAFTCICGDLTVNGTDAELTTYKGYVDSYSPDTPVYAVFGNHDTYQGLYNNTAKYTGQPFNYTFAQGDDVFIMVGNISGYSGDIGTLFTRATFQWLYEQLEANRNKRCFLFQHILSAKGSGDGYNIYPHTKLSGTEATVFESLLRHYHNVIWFHGHSHMRFDLQGAGRDMANYDSVFGCHSIHIPSLSVPRDVNSSGSGYETIYADSEGYVVDVYENGIHLRGRDFIRSEYMPIASYWLDTTPKTVEEGTYFDSTGTIDSGVEQVNEKINLTWHEGYEVNTSSGSLRATTGYTVSDLITLESGYEYTVYGTNVGGFSLYPQFYGSSGNYIGVGKIADGHGWATSAKGNVSYVVAPVSGATAIRLQGYTGSLSGAMASKVTMYRRRV